jgi:hypothetical protein
MAIAAQLDGALGDLAVLDARCADGRTKTRRAQSPE